MSKPTECIQRGVDIVEPRPGHPIEQRPRGEFTERIVEIAGRPALPGSKHDAQRGSEIRRQVFFEVDGDVGDAGLEFELLQALV